MQSKVKVGPATVAGYGATLVGLVASVLVAVFGVDQDQAALIASAVFAVVSFAVTQWGRFAQARAREERSSWGAQKIVNPAPGTAYPVESPTGTTVVFSGTSGTVPRPHASSSSIPVHDDVIKDNALEGDTTGCQTHEGGDR